MLATENDVARRRRVLPCFPSGGRVPSRPATAAVCGTQGRGRGRGGVRLTFFSPFVKRMRKENCTGRFLSLIGTVGKNNTRGQYNFTVPFL